MLEEVLRLEVLTVFVVFCRIGSAIMVLPGFGDGFVSVRIRLLLALSVSVVVAIVVDPVASIRDPAALILLLFGEILIGIFIGLTARILINALQVAGTIIAFQASMANSFAFDVVSAQQGALLGNFLGTLGLVLIFVSDMHHLMLIGLVESYTSFPPGRAPAAADLATVITRVVADAFRIGAQLSAPFILVGIMMSVGAGLLARLMPQVQVFFIMLPVQIAAGMLVFALTLAAGMSWYLGEFESTLLSLTGR